MEREKNSNSSLKWWCCSFCYIKKFLNLKFYLNWYLLILEIMFCNKLYEYNILFFNSVYYTELKKKKTNVKKGQFTITLPPHNLHWYQSIISSTINILKHILAFEICFSSFPLKLNWYIWPEIYKLINLIIFFIRIFTKEDFVINFDQHSESLLYHLID